jgi:H+/Cl- antiporter ClcA
MTIPLADRSTNNGAIMAAILSAGIGAFAVGFIVILNEAGLFTAPTLYGPTGGVSGRTTIAAAIWLVAWLVLHHRWKSRHVEPRPIKVTTLVLILGGVTLTFPPVWGLFG